MGTTSTTMGSSASTALQDCSPEDSSVSPTAMGPPSAAVVDKVDAAPRSIAISSGGVEGVAARGGAGDSVGVENNGGSPESRPPRRRGRPLGSVAATSKKRRALAAAAASAALASTPVPSPAPAPATPPAPASVAPPDQALASPKLSKKVHYVERVMAWLDTEEGRADPPVLVVVRNPVDGAAACAGGGGEPIATPAPSPAGESYVTVTAENAHMLTVRECRDILRLVSEKRRMQLLAAQQSDVAARRARSPAKRDRRSKHIRRRARGRQMLAEGVSGGDRRVDAKRAFDVAAAGVGVCAPVTPPGHTRSRNRSRVRSNPFTSAATEADFEWVSDPEEPMPESISQSRLDQFDELWAQIVADEPLYDPVTLRGSYLPGSGEVYGEVRRDFVSRMIREAAIGPNDIFYDLGAGVGNVCVQVAALSGCRAVGVEIRPELVAIGQRLIDRSVERLRESGFAPDFSRDRVSLVEADISTDAVPLADATVVYLCNLAYPAALERSVLVRLNASIAQDARVVALRDLGPRYRRSPLVSERRTSVVDVRDPLALFRVPWRCFEIGGDAASWTSHAIRLYVYEVDRVGGPSSSSLLPPLPPSADLPGGSSVVTIPLKRRHRRLKLPPIVEVKSEEPRAEIKAPASEKEVTSAASGRSPAMRGRGLAVASVPSCGQTGGCTVDVVGLSPPLSPPVELAGTASPAAPVPVPPAPAPPLFLAELHDRAPTEARFPEITQLRELFPEISHERIHRVLYNVGYVMDLAVEAILSGETGEIRH